MTPEQATYLNQKFQNLCHQAYDPNTGLSLSLSAIDELWREFFLLKNLYFACNPSYDLKNPKPFLAELDNKTWAFVFTDTKSLQIFATENNLLDEDGGSLFIALPAEEALSWLLLMMQQHSLFGIRVNHGADGFFSALQELPGIYKRVLDKDLNY